MKLLSLESELIQYMGQCSRLLKESWFSNIDLQRMKEQNKKINQLKFFETQNYGFKEMIGRFEGQSSKGKVEKVKKIKKFQPKSNNKRGRCKKMMNKKSFLKKIALEQILELIGDQ
ncbi:unnamed protein product [Paramecium sonneborni]|uniref:Uncharacterized protein n=1 Tax=Paramecium sonneborni TaxID=65129 RepID=A0A8S1PBP9_9CILI|nr:unnamed protein product [Paramecium sonneborni]